ncbi:MAG: DUF7146 domain-containing protein [Alphaproteobacteria bacterium]
MGKNFPQGEIACVKQHLTPFLLELAKNIFPARTVVIKGNEIRIGTKGSLSINRLTGEYYDHETGAGGDILTLIGNESGRSFPESLEWAKAFIGVIHHQQGKTHTAPVKMPQNGNLETCKAIWAETKPIKGTIAQSYLNNRGITILPHDLRFHPCLWNPAQHKKMPAMVAVIRDLAGSGKGLHRTFLTPEGGRAEKLLLGDKKTHAIRLCPIGVVLGLAEGIETALSAMQLTGRPCWSVCDAGNMAAVQLPETVKRVIIFADNDKAGHEAAAKALQIFEQQGRRVQLQPPPEGKDWNDYLLIKKAVATNNGVTR